MGEERPIVLIGPRGAGKTTVGAALAARLGGRHLDTDALIVEKTGQSIAALFDRGEAHFRAVEAEVIADLAGRPAAVISVGGGAILKEANRRCLRNLGPIVWLDAPPCTLQSRIARDPNSATQRPRLTAASIEEEWAELCATREPLYRGLADVRLPTAHATVADVVDAVVAAVAALDDRRNDTA